MVVSDWFHVPVTLLPAKGPTVPTGRNRINPVKTQQYTVELGYNVMKGTEYLVSL
jgi:hypothetical protein